ncbi:hypothetical protein IKQ21_05365, partial [bacterium]|nr:hypothetical protein [bacterium]
NVNTRRVADMDIFKETLQELFAELNIDKSNKVVLNIPAVTYRVAEYPAIMDEAETSNAILESLVADEAFSQNDEPCFSAAKLPSSSMQFNRVVYTAAQHNVIYEMVMSIKALGYKIYAIDSAISSTYNALNYIGRLSNIQPDTSWVLMIVDNFMCRVIPMIGYSPVDAFEEKISIGEVLEDSENYATVLSVAQPWLKNNPSKYLYVVSKTKIINAEILASRLQYDAPIIHQDASVSSKEEFLNISPEVNPDYASQISLDVIGAAIRQEWEKYRTTNLNLYNSSLGDIYIQDQPPQIEFLGRTIILSNENLVKFFIAVLIIALAIVIPLFILIQRNIFVKNNELSNINAEIDSIQKFLDENPEFSADVFNEGDEIRSGIAHNKGVYSYYSIVGTEIPKKLWLTHLKLGDKTTIEGQADNLESIYGFYRNIKDYDQKSDLKLQKLGLASKSKNAVVSDDGGFDTESILTSLNADFYEFRISNEPEVSPKDLEKKDGDNGGLPDLEPIN